MKKFLLTAALLLAVVTSLTAGTLAAYNQTLSVTGDLHSKKFYFNKTASKTFDQTIKIVPGDKVVYKVEVDQDMEVPVEYTVSSTINGSDKLAARLTKTVTLKNGNDMTVQQGDSFTVNKNAGKDDFYFLVEVKWENTNDVTNNALDIAASNQNVKLDVTINGVSTEATQEFGPDSVVDTIKA